MKSQYPSTYYRVSLKAIITNNKGEFLCAKEYDNANYSLPGGGLDHEETVHECLRRELYEEASIEADFTEEIIDTRIFWLESSQAWLLWLVYSVKLPEDFSFGPGQDTSDVAFVHPETFKNADDEAGREVYKLYIAHRDKFN